MTSALLARRFVSDHLRNPVNLFVLVAVPVAFVLVAAGPLAEAGETLGWSSPGKWCSASA